MQTQEAVEVLKKYVNNGGSIPVETFDTAIHHAIEVMEKYEALLARCGDVEALETRIEVAIRIEGVDDNKLLAQAISKHLRGE